MAAPKTQGIQRGRSPLYVAVPLDFGCPPGGPPNAVAPVPNYYPHHSRTRHYIDSILESPKRPSELSPPFPVSTLDFMRHNPHRFMTPGSETSDQQSVSSASDGTISPQPLLDDYDASPDEVKNFSLGQKELEMSQPPEKILVPSPTPSTPSPTERLPKKSSPPPNSGTADSEKKAKKSRTTFKYHQVSALEQVFAMTHYPDNDTLDWLATTLQLPEAKIKVWFQNKRARWKKQRVSEFGAIHPGVPGAQAHYMMTDPWAPHILPKGTPPSVPKPPIQYTSPAPGSYPPSPGVPLPPRISLHSVAGLNPTLAPTSSIPALPAAASTRYALPQYQVPTSAHVQYPKTTVYQ